MPPFVGAVALLVACGIASGILTGIARRYAVRHAILDVPNERSSHVRPTPRGGGVAIAAVLLVGTVAAGLGGWLRLPLVVAVSGGGLAVATLGWIDDRRGLSPLTRLAVQSASAVWAVAWIGGTSSLLTWSLGVSWGIGAAVLGVLAIVWMTNLYNFMDGIDGLAAGQAVVAGLVGGALLLLVGAGELALVSFLVAAASAGFLPWNWAPARIFMGDVSSGLLGFVFGVVAVGAAAAGRLPLLVWTIVLGVFIFDATVTLLRRAARGQRWYAAHRLHAYQRLVQGGWSHRRVSSAALVLAALLGGIATVAVVHPVWLLPGAALSILLLAGAYVAIERINPLPSGRGTVAQSMGARPDTASRFLS